MENGKWNLVFALPAILLQIEISIKTARKRLEGGEEKRGGGRWNGEQVGRN